ncbi:MAG: ABC transporter permease, partial [Anaerolineae bacterium]
MLDRWFQEPRLLGLAQAAVATVLALAVVLLARHREIHVEKDAIIALLRGLVQVVAVGSVLLLLLQGPRWTGIPVLLAMMLAAATIAARRARGIPGAFWVSLAG